ncbi:hypothetical protein V6N11_072280 [Hibiscus sabdariffa]|uniref:Uncharacterized protein n=1 Tax=Hibiscus sabdariffa TaxID=183260 RepID=A0ABR2U3A6_9ROSI
MGILGLLNFVVRMDEELDEWLSYGSPVMLDGGWSSDEQWGSCWSGDGEGFGRFIMGDGQLLVKFIEGGR